AGWGRAGRSHAPGPVRAPEHAIVLWVREGRGGPGGARSVGAGAGGLGGDFGLGAGVGVLRGVERAGGLAAEAGLVLVDELEVAGVDDDAGGLSEDADEVDAPDEVEEEAEPAAEAEPPEGLGDDALALVLADDPLDEHAPEEGDLSGEA